MAINIIDKLNDDWWKSANEAAKWKPKFECMGALFTELTGNAETNVELTCEIADHKKLPDLLKIMTKWLTEEKHVFTRIAMLRFLPVLMQAMPKKAVQKYENQLIEAIMTVQWTEKKAALLQLVNPCLISLWKKTGFELKSDEVKPRIIAALKHRGKESRKSALEFLAECTMYSQRKKQMLELCQDKELGNLLGKLASGDKEKEVKIAGCMLFHGLNESGVLKGKKTNKDFVTQYDNLTANKRAKANLEAAKKQYDEEKKVKAPPKAGGDKEEEKEEKKEEPKKKGKKGKKGKGKAAEEKKEEPKPAEAAPAAGGGEALADDEKIEDGKKYKKVVKKVTKERPKAGSGKEYTKGAGGVIGPEGGAERKSHKNKKPKKYTEGQGLDAKMLEDNKKALGAVDKFKAVKGADAFKKLDTWIGKEADGLAKGTKIGDRLKAMEAAHKNMKDIPKDKWSDLYDSLITLASETMGWEGTDSKNPMLVKYFLELIGIAMSHADCGKQTGAFKPYLSWALQRFGEKKFEKHAAQCLIATCYQFSPKVVLSYAEKLLFDPEDPKNDPFKNDKNWGPVIAFMGLAVKEFGVDNCYVNRVINIVHQKLGKARDKNAKDACYGLLTTLYEQLGKDWEDVLLSGVPKGPAKTLKKKFGAIKTPGTWKQLRCTKKESVPAAAGQEMEQYEEEVIEWVEVKPQAAAAPAVEEKKEEAKPAEAAPVEEAKEEEAPKEPTPEPEPEPTPPPPPGPLESTAEARKWRLGKCGKKLQGLFEQSKPLDKSVVKEYDLQITPKKIDKNHPGIFNDSPGEDYKCGDMEKWKANFADKKNQVKKWKPVVASLCAWIAAFEGTKFFNDVYNCIDLMLYWANSIFTENPQPNVGKMLMDLWKQICESCAASYKPLGEAEGKMLLPIVANQAFGTKQLVQGAMELCDAFELIYHPAACYKIYLSTIERTKSNQTAQVCMQRLARCVTDYGLVKCDPKKFSVKMKKQPYKDAKDFVKHFMKIYCKLKDKKTMTAAGEVLKYCYEVVGDKGFWKECKVKGAQKGDVEKFIEDAESYKKGKYRPPEKQWIGDLIKEKRRQEELERKMREAGGGGDGAGGGGDVAGAGGMAGGGVQLPMGPLPGLEAAGFTPIRFTPSQLLALKYGPAPHQWKMHNFSEYVSRLPPAFCMDWDEFEQKKKTVSTNPTAPYIKIGNVRIDVETGKPFEEISTNDGGVKAFASVPPNNGVGIGKTGMNMPGREAEEKQFLDQANKDDEIMADILGVERDNAEYFDTANDGSSWLALYDVNGFDETDRQIQLIEMRNIYGVKTLQTWLHTGKNVTIVESSVNKLLSVLLPWLQDLINTETLLPDQQRYEQTYQILQLLKFCSRFATLKNLSPSELTAFFKTLLSAITYDNINALFGHNYKRILAEINDVLIKSILRTPPTDTLCVLISLLKECDPTNDSQSIKQYADACCKLLYKVMKRYDRVICRDTDSVVNVFVEIVKYFSTISYETWQMAEQQRRFPLKVIQMVIARLVWFCGSDSMVHLSTAIDKIQIEQNSKHQRSMNDAALHQRDTYAKRLIVNFIHACQRRKMAARPLGARDQPEHMTKYEEDEDEKLKPHNIKQAQSSNNGFLQPSSAEYVAQSTLQKVHDADRQAAQYARDNKIDLNFALWVGMTGRNKAEYLAQ